MDPYDIALCKLKRYKDCDFQDDSKSVDRKAVPPSAPLQHIENEQVTKTKASRPERLFHR